MGYTGILYLHEVSGYRVNDRREPRDRQSGMREKKSMSMSKIMNILSVAGNVMSKPGFFHCGK